MLIKDVRIDKFHGRDNEDISDDERTLTGKKVKRKKQQQTASRCQTWISGMMEEHSCIILASSQFVYFAW